MFQAAFVCFFMLAAPTDAILGPLLDTVQGLPPAVLPYVAPFVKEIRDVVNNYYVTKQISHEQVDVQIVEYAKDFYEAMDQKCYKEKVPMEKEIHYLKIAVGAVVVLMVIEVYNSYRFRYNNYGGTLAGICIVLFLNKDRLNHQEVMVALRAQPNTALPLFEQHFQRLLEYIINRKSGFLPE
ncbi:hypothetical protein RvY_02328 [Ramazzottius varieornatus]|uniref:Uncharacterized protein n=1 Tax=Ramazzottius varieornatus TaxID=947166 RepID=A0A1D1UJB2_RAMVA|nr:hypothetical protein RvY_02328 [Ramazzottius varieornatus]